MLNGDVKRFLLMLSVSSFILGVAMSSGLYFVPIKAEMLGASDIEIGMLGFLRAVPYIFLPATIGFFLRRTNKVFLYAVSPVTSMIFYIFMYISDDLLQIISIQTLMGLTFVFYWPIAEMMVASSTTPSDRVRIFSYYSVSWTSGFFVGPSVGGLIAEKLGLNESFLFSAMLSFVALPFALLIKVPRAGDFEAVNDCKDDSSTSLRLLPYFIMLTIQSMVYATLMVIFPNYAWRLGINEFYIGTIFTVLSLARLLSFFFVGARVKSPHRLSFTMASVLSAIPFLFIALLPSLMSFYIAFAIYASTLSYFVSIIFGRLTTGVGSEKYGFIVGLYEGIFGVGFAFGPLLAGFLSDSIGIRESFLIQSFLALGIAAIAHAFRLESIRRP